MSYKIVDPDDLIRATSLANLGTAGLADGNIFIDYDALKIYIAEDGVNLGPEGVQLQCIYSYIKIQRLTDTDLVKLDTPFKIITEESFELVDGWDFGDQTTRDLIRDGGYAVLNPLGYSEKEYGGFAALKAPVEATDQAYYIQEPGGVPIDIVLPGQVNQCILLFEVLSDETAADIQFTANNTIESSILDFTANFSIGDKIYVRLSPTNNGVYEVATVAANVLTVVGTPFTVESNAITHLLSANDYRTFIQFFLREQGKKYGFYDLLAATGKTSMTYKLYPIDLSNDFDAKVTEDDITAAGYGITIEFLENPIAIDFGEGPKNFSIRIDGKGLTSEEIYMALQEQLRRSTDIDIGSFYGPLRGDTVPSLAVFVGDKLYTQYTPYGGVYIVNFHADDTNTIVYTDNDEVQNEYEFVATGSLQPNQYLMSDLASKYFMFLADAPTAVYGTTSAEIVDDADGNPISGLVNGRSSIGFTMAFDTNVQGGRTPNTPMNIVIIAAGLSGAQDVKVLGTIYKTTGNNYSLPAPLERGFSNPS